jgi:hypothetical protein
MAEPPNALTLLLSDDSDPLRMYDSLASQRCLSSKALANRARVIQLIQSTVVDFQGRPPMAGPTLWYVVIGALSGEGFLNQHAMARLRADRTSQDRSARLRAAIQELWWRLRY